MRSPQRCIAWLVLGLCTGSVAGCARHDADSPAPTAQPVRFHPVFRTTLTGSSRARPAIQVDILDASKYWFLTAKLYLAVQSSRFPAETWVIVPLNVGDFDSCRKRFVQLPFEVGPDDTLVFNLLDENTLTSAQERLILGGCRLAGYCVLVGGSFYCPGVVALVSPRVAEAASEILGGSVVAGLTFNRFTNYGTAEFVVPGRLPAQPHQANRLTILDDSKYARVVLKIYGPEQSLPFTALHRFDRPFPRHLVASRD